MRITCFSLILPLMFLGCKSSDTKNALVEGLNISTLEQRALAKEAELNNNPDAAEKLAEHYMLVEQDYKRAGYWFKKASELGDAHHKAVYESFKKAVR